MRKLIFLLTLIFALPAWSQVVSPPDRASTTSVRPTISADFNTRIRGARIWVDGTEFTDYMRTRGDTVTLVPPYNLDYGVHNVQLATRDGYQANWSFAIVNPTSAYRNTYPYNNTGYYPNNGTYYPNDPYYNNNTTYYPNDPYYDNDTAGVEDILPAILPYILNRR